MLTDSRHVNKPQRWFSCCCCSSLQTTKKHFWRKVPPPVTKIEGKRSMTGEGLSSSLSPSGSWLSLTKEIKIACVNPGFRGRGRQMQSPSRKPSATVGAARARAPEQPSDSDTKAALIRFYLHNVSLARRGFHRQTDRSHISCVQHRWLGLFSSPALDGVMMQHDYCSYKDSLCVCVLGRWGGGL